MKKTVWVLRSIVDAIHDAQLAEHGGAPGIRDAGLLNSALARPSICRCALAASYASGIVRNHPFVDGNKRTAFFTAYVFRRLNGLEPIADEVGATGTILTLAAGQLPETDYAARLRASAKATRKT